MSIHSSIIKRLILAWLILSTIIGAVVYYFEHAQIDQVALDIAIKHSNTFTPEQINGIRTMSPDTILELQKKVDELTRRQFVAIDIYDIQGTHLAAAFNYDTFALQSEIEERHHQFPLDKDLHYEKFVSDNISLIQILLPLTLPDGSTAGYFEGVYLVDDNTINLINERIYYVLSLVFLVSLAMTILLYPIIIKLNAELLSYSNDLLRTNIELLEVLGSVISSRDSTTNSHNYRVTLYAVRLGERLGLDHTQLQQLIVGSFLHDVGKIGVDDAILNKKGPLTPEEVLKMQEHVTIGLEIVSKSKWLRGAQDVVAYHHEKFDGSGYSNYLKGEEIPLNARVFAIADVFDALTSERPYKHAYSFVESINYLNGEKGKHFDPRIVDAFTSVAKRAYKELNTSDDQTLAKTLADTIQKYFYNSSLKKELIQSTSDIISDNTFLREQIQRKDAA